MSKSNNVLGYYSTVLKGWQTKVLGAKPTLEQFEAAHKLGCREGKQALAMAMYLREGGATDGQVKMACIIQWGSSGSHHNKRRDLQGAGFVKTVPQVSDAQGHKVYAIALTAKGTAKLTAEPKVAKVTKAAKKAAKAKPAKAENAVTEPVAGVAAEVQAPATA